MKLFHLSDLHIGKRFREYSLVEDQKHVLAQILSLVESEAPDVVMIAGDVYDRAMPSEEAVSVFDDFLFRLFESDARVMIISGNHDSQERLAYGGRIMNKSGIHISPEFNIANYENIIKPVMLNDEFGEVNFYLLPFITPAAVRCIKKEQPISNTSEAVKAVIDDMSVDGSKRNILIAHQFVTGASVSKSETSYVGGTDNVDVSVFEPFDYVALGHIHGPQHIGRETVRYCGTPLKYSFSEIGQKKSITVVEVGEKGDIGISELPLDRTLHDLVEIHGSFDEVIRQSNNKDFVRVVLDNRNEFNVWNRLHEYFGFLAEIDFADSSCEREFSSAELEKVENMSRTDLFAEYFAKYNDGRELSERQREIVEKAFEQAAKEISGGGI